MSKACDAVVVGKSADRRRAAALLDAAGFDVSAADSGTELNGHCAADALVVVIDGGDGAARIRAVRATAESRPDAPVLAVMPSGSSNAALRRALLAGAGGIVLEDDLAAALVATARAMQAGQLAVPSSLGRQIAPRPLSYREKQILGLVVNGSTNREIAHKLYLAESTVKTHLSSAFRKLDARSRSEAVARILDPEAGYGAGILEIVDGAAVGDSRLAS
jgi:DNA-binding NarL/FixJ family response regulator